MTQPQTTKIAAILNRLNDGFGKTLLGIPENKPILLDLLNAVFADKHSAAVHERIKDVTLLDRELTPMHDGDKSCRVDLLCETDSGSHINIELQTYIDRDLGIRVLVYTAKIIAQLLDQKIPYSQNRPTVIIVFTDKDVRQFLKQQAESGKDKRWHHIFALLDTEDLLRLTDKFEVHFIEVQKYPKINLEDMNRLGQWNDVVTTGNGHRAYFRHSNDGLETSVVLLNNKDFMQIYREREEMDRISAYANGMEDGLEKGFKQGHEEGKSEAHRDLATKLLQKGFDADEVSELTDLSPAGVQSLKTELQI